MGPRHREWIWIFAVLVPYAFLLRARVSLRPQDVLATALVVAMGAVIAARARQTTFSRRNQEGIERYMRGDFASASEIFRHNALRFRHPAPMLGISSFNLGLAQLRLGDVDGALQLLHAVERSSGLRRAPVVHRTCPLWISICYGVRGEADAARRWLELADRTGRTAFSLELLARAILLCREGNFQRAASLLTERRDGIPPADRHDVLPLLDLVHAFARSKLDGAPRPELRSMVTGDGEPGRTQPPASYRFLACSWESFRSFLEAYDLLEK